MRHGITNSRLADLALRLERQPRDRAARAPPAATPLAGRAVAVAVAEGSSFGRPPSRRRTARLASAGISARGWVVRPARAPRLVRAQRALARREGAEEECETAAVAQRRARQRSREGRERRPPR